MHRKFLIWDREGSPPPVDGTTVLWRQYVGAGEPNVISIPLLVEEQAETLRSRYLAWIHDLGEAVIGGGRVIDQLSLRPGFSYWWMSSLAQKFNASGTSGIECAIKALALEVLLATHQPSSIILISGNHRLAACLQNHCCNIGTDFVWRSVSVREGGGIHSSLYRSLPRSWQASIYLVWYLLKLMPMFLKCNSVIPVISGDVLFVDVLVHLDKRASMCGRFISNYWTTIVDKLPKWQVASNWFHLYFRHPVTPSPLDARCLVERFNESAKNFQFHVLIEQSMSFRILLAGLRDYMKVRRAFAQLHDIKFIRPANSSLDLWPFHSEDWADSLCGKEAMTNCLRVSLFESIVNHLPRQRVGVYIMENQPWEMAFIHAWRAGGHGVLIGSPHTTIRFWDLRYHCDERCYQKGSDNSLPLPDKLAVNGPVGRNSILAGGFPPARVVEVEALRFLHLLTRQSRKPSASLEPRELHVLVCGDFLAETNRQLVEWLEIAVQSLSMGSVIVFKPHPACTFNPAKYPALTLKMTDAPLAELFNDCDVVFASNTTSAAVDAYCAGVPVVQMLDGVTFNMSPLRGLPGVQYVSDPDELAGLLLGAQQRDEHSAQPYFCLDLELLRWRKLLRSEDVVVDMKEVL